MCNHTSELHDQVEASMHRGNLLLNQSVELQLNSMDFQADSRELLDKVSSVSKINIGQRTLCFLDLFSFWIFVIILLHFITVLVKALEFEVQGGEGN